MEITHRLGELNISKVTDSNVGFNLSNKKGSFAAFFSRPSSKYCGLFFFDTKLMTMYKFIENIEIEGGNDVKSLKNYLYFVERENKDFTESFVMPSGYNSLLYELDAAGRINITLDCRDVYDSRQWGRNYEIIRYKDCAVVKFTKKTDEREDTSSGKEEFTLYLAIKSDYDYYELADTWFERFYDADFDRNMSDTKRFVYNALNLHGRRFVFSMSKDQDEAINECNFAFNHFEKLKKDEEAYLSRILHDCGADKVLKREDISDETRVAYVNAINSLNNLIVHEEFRPGILAGFPWFFQYWSRDSLVCLKTVYRTNNVLGGKILYDYLNSINNEGRLFNIVGKDSSLGVCAADAHGWLFVRCRELIDEMNKNKSLLNSINRISKKIKECGDKDICRNLDETEAIACRRYEHWHRVSYEIESSLERSLSRLHRLRTTDLLEYNGQNETWMDTSFDNDNRCGFRIEIQAFRLNMYRLMFEITQNKTHAALESITRSKVREVFFDGKQLADGMNDFTQRPNIYLAAYAYPELLNQKEWEECFSNNLKSTWLSWGGLSTIEKNHRLFCDKDLGEDFRSYHRGDSWFWVNNICAISLHRISKEKFGQNISQIIKASTEDILWLGCIGAHSEISDARQLSSRGCFNQSWSNAMYIEMIDEVFGI